MEPLIAEPAPLTNDEIRRYSRHLIMPNVGIDGQGRLKASKVLLVGTGGLGSPVAMYLAAAGVGTIGLVDFDTVDESNLHRQVIHGTKDIGKRKTESARETILDINPFVDVRVHETALRSDNALEIIEPYDLVIDGTDNFPTRYLVNDACVLLGKPNVYGSIFRFEGQVSVFYAEEGPCYRCLYPEPPPPGLVPSCAEAGVIGVLPGVIGSLQALEAIKWITGAGTSLAGRLLLFDALALRWREMRLRRDPECPACGDHPTIDHLIDYEEFCGMRASMPAREDPEEITPAELKRRLDENGRVLLVDVREPYELRIASFRSLPVLHIPLAELPSRLGELDADFDIVVACRSGSRSAHAARYLRDAGFPHARSLAGGINAWSDEIDPSIQKY